MNWDNTVWYDQCGVCSGQRIDQIKANLQLVIALNDLKKQVDKVESTMSVYCTDKLRYFDNLLAH
jgi:hypothetical protein